MSIKSWKTRDILIVAVLGIVLGILSTVVDYAYTAGGAALGPLLPQTLIGIVMFTALFIPFVVRRPGAALMGMIVIGLVQVPFSPNGFASLVVSAVYGLFVEIAFLITRYKRYSLLMLILTAVIVGAIGLGIGYVPNAFHETSIGAQLLLWVLVIGSCALGAWLVTVLANALIRSGLLNNLQGESDEEIALG
ncbi:MAG: ECF transporter S component [Chloroflexota bacterium]